MADDGPIPVIACFRESQEYHLPSFENSGEANPSTKTHQSQEPPLCCIPGREARAWAEKGSDLSPDIQERLRNYFLPGFDYSIRHKTEADVLRSAHLHLIHPVSVVLCARYHDVTCVSESLMSGGGSAGRCDLTFNNTPSKTFAMFEAKRRAVIRTEEFIEAQLPDLAYFDAQMNSPDPITESLFTKAAYQLMTQAAAYAVIGRTRYVVLFDWDHLLMVIFPRLQVEDGYAGNYCEITMIKNDQSHMMRPALLGFLEEALFESENP